MYTVCLQQWSKVACLSIAPGVFSVEGCRQVRRWETSINRRQPVLPEVNIGFSSSCMASFHQGQGNTEFYCPGLRGDLVYNVPFYYKLFLLPMKQNFKYVLLVVVERNNERNVLHDPSQSIHGNLVHLGLAWARDIFGLLSWRLSFSSSSAAPSYVCVLFTSPCLDCRLLCKGHLYNLYKCVSVTNPLSATKNCIQQFWHVKVQVAPAVCKSWKSSVAFIELVCLSGRIAWTAHQMRLSYQSKLMRNFGILFINWRRRKNK